MHLRIDLKDQKTVGMYQGERHETMSQRFRGYGEIYSVQSA